MRALMNFPELLCCFAAAGAGRELAGSKKRFLINELFASAVATAATAADQAPWSVNWAFGEQAAQLVSARAAHWRCTTKR